jgi:oxygen-independent coproporphyrinogen-3 oxidase
LVCEGDLIRLFDTIRGNLSISETAEISVEANPESLTRQRLEALKKCGVNRLSIGLQSASEAELKLLGRIHTLSEFEAAFANARELGFDNINIDIMYALPEQTIEGLERTLDYVISLCPEHISSYCLKIEGETPFSKMKLSLPDEDTQYDMYMAMCERLESAGYTQYEVSNFAKNGRRCVHNLKYWHQNEYIGFGPSAHSFYEGVRYFYEGDIGRYLADIADGGLPEKICESEAVMNEAERMDEYVMLAMRLCDGVDVSKFKVRFGTDFDSVYDLDRYIKSGHILKNGSSYRFSSKGFFVSNFILSDILDNI